MKEAEIWRKVYDLAMIETDEKDCLFAKDLLNCMANNIDKEVQSSRAKAIFIDCFKLLDAQLKQPNWIAVNEICDKLIKSKYAKDKNEQMLCAELISVVVNQIDRVHGKEWEVNGA